MRRVFWLVALLASRLSAQATVEQLAEDAHDARLKKDYVRAADDYRGMLREQPHSAELWSNVGLMYHLAGKYADAVPAFEHSLKENPSQFPANFFLGADLLASDRPQAAQPFLEKAAQLMPNEPIVVITLARSQMALGDAKTANLLYSRAARLDGRNANAWFGLGATYFSLMRESLARFQSHPDSIYKRALLEDKEVGNPLAPEDAEQALEKNPDDERALFWHVRDTRKLALDALNRAGALAPDSPRTHHVLGEIYLEQGNYAQARQEFETLLAADPSSLPAKLALARVDQGEGHFEEALNRALDALKSHPRDAEASFIAAEVLVRQDQFEQALPFAKDAINVESEAPPEAHALLAKIYEHRDQTQAAILELIKALPSDPDGSYHYRLYRLYQKAGRTQEATAALNQYREVKDRPAKQQIAAGKRIEALLQ